MKGHHARVCSSLAESDCFDLSSAAMEQVSNHYATEGMMIRIAKNYNCFQQETRSDDFDRQQDS